jgi:hypothetical protein
MVTVKFVGKPTDLGRFGPVRKGDVITLTDKEYHCVQDDKRFELTDERPPNDPQGGQTSAEQTRLDLSQKSREELEDLAFRMRNIKYRAGDKKPTLVRAILVALGHERPEAAKDVPPGETTEPKNTKSGTVSTGGLSKPKE